MLKGIAKDNSLIPPGPYCYLSLRYSKSQRRLLTLVCPYWSLREDKETQNNGYCSFMEEGDWDCPTAGLLWDQVKECGENDDLLAEEYNGAKFILLEKKWMEKMLKSGFVRDDEKEEVRLKIQSLSEELVNQPT